MYWNCKTYHQRAIDFILSNKKCAVFYPCGMNKTSITLTAFLFLKIEGQARKMLVVAPPTVAAFGWLYECKKWDHLKNFKVRHIKSKKDFFSAVNQEADIYTVSRDTLPAICKELQKAGTPLSKWFDLYVFDESHKWKDSNTSRFKTLRWQSPTFERVVLLSGTPIPNDRQDLWSQMYLLDSGQRLGRTITIFRENFVDTRFLPGSTIPIRKFRAEMAEIADSLISDLCISCSPDEQELPEVTYIEHPVEFDKKLRVWYEDIKKKKVFEFTRSGNPEMKTFEYAVSVFSALSQFTSGFMYTDEKTIQVHTLKLRALKDIYDKEGNLIVAINFTAEREAILKTFPDAEAWDKKTSLDRWNQKKIKMLVVNPKECAEGNNLQDGGCVQVWFSLTSSLIDYQQFNKRLHRPGQKNKVRIYHIMVENSLDQKIIDRLQNKDLNQTQFLSSVIKDELCSTTY